MDKANSSMARQAPEAGHPVRGTTEHAPQSASVALSDDVRIQQRTGEKPERRFGILVVDDEPCLREVVSLGMRQQGFAVWQAAHGQEALDQYRRHHETIDMVLMDVAMPGLDGPQALAALQELNPRIHCCFMSGDLGAYTEARLYDLGAAAVLRKPFHLTGVAEVLWEWVRDVGDGPCRNGHDLGARLRMRLRMIN
jgi:CheY-like chemotaxis protein